MKKYKVKILVALIFVSGLSYSQVYYDGVQPGKPESKLSKSKDVFKNKIIELNINKDPSSNSIESLQIENRITGYQITSNENKVFQIITTKNDTLSNRDFKIISSEKINFKDKGIGNSYLLKNEKQQISFTIIFSINPNENFINQKFIFADKEQKIKKVITNILPKNEKTTILGIVDGSPIISENLFFAIENPLFTTDLNSNFYYLGITAPQDSAQHANFNINSVIGTTPENQLRRGFLYYLEKRRARPYQPFLHYNSWYDLSYNADPLKEEDMLDRVKKWDDEFAIKRNVKLDGFLWDSGWDDFDHLWKFNKYLPNGFKKLNQQAEKLGTGMGVWLSPWGGYDDAVVARMKGAKANNPQLELNENGFTVAQPNYYQYFRKVAVNFVENENVKIFKFDGVGAGLKASGPGKKYVKDIEGFLTIVKDIRTIKPNTYFSLTVGTWPSPFWLMYGDNIWRGGSDMNYMGKGTKRQRWMNYRDGDTYDNIVKRAPLYPLNAIMNHGLTIGTKGTPKVLENDNASLSDDMWAFFASGTSLQEMYVNPHLLNNENWNELAKVIKFTREHQNILVDTHWIGGDPKNGDVYGYGSWNPEGAILLLRNPSEQEKTFEFTLDKILEIPKQFSGEYIFKDARGNSQNITTDSKVQKKLTLKPFEVQVFEIKRK